MVFNSYQKDNLPIGYRKAPFETEDKARIIIDSFEGNYALILDKNNKGEYFEGIICLSDEEDLPDEKDSFKLCDPKMPENDKECLRFRFENLLEILVKD